MQGLLLQQQPLRVFCRRGTTARTVRTPQARRAVRLPTCTSPCRRATALRSPRGRAAGIRPLFIRTSATYCRRVSTGAEICPRYFETGRTYFELCPTCFFLAPMRAQHAGNQFPLFPCPPRRFPAAVPTPHLSAPRTSMRWRGARGTGTRRALLLSSAYIAEPKRCYLAKTDNFFVFIGKTQRFFFANFGADFRKVVRHKRTKSVIELVLLIEFSQNWIWSRMGSNNAHATDIYYPQRENYILAWREWLLLIHSIRQCEKPDKRISKIQSSRFSHKIT